MTTHAYKVTAGFWCTLSFFVVAGSTIAFMMPFWLVNNNSKPNYMEPDLMVTLNKTTDAQAACGIMSFCLPYTKFPTNPEWTFSDNLYITRCPVYDKIDKVPTMFGKVAAIMFAAGCIILFVAWIFSAISLCYGFICNVSTFLLISIIQIFCLVINGIAILLWTLSWDQADFTCGKQFCGGDFKQFNTGNCEMGWAFMLGLASTGGILVAVLFGCISLTLQRSKSYD